MTSQLGEWGSYASSGSADLICAAEKGEAARRQCSHTIRPGPRLGEDRVAQW